MTTLILLKDFLETQVELWLPVAEAPDYDVSNFGNVRSYLRQVSKGGRTGFVTERVSEPRLLSINYNKDSRPDKRGYGVVCLQSLVGEKNFIVHLLVAKAFLPNLHGDAQVNHKNAVKSDNRLPNLEWSDHDRNHEHMTVNGLRQSGEKHWAAKLTVIEVRAIKIKLAAGMRPVDVAREHSLARDAVWKIQHGITWKTVKLDG